MIRKLPSCMMVGVGERALCEPMLSSACSARLVSGMHMAILPSVSTAQISASVHASVHQLNNHYQNDIAPSIIKCLFVKPTIHHCVIFLCVLSIFSLYNDYWIDKVWRFKKIMLGCIFFSFKWNEDLSSYFILIDIKM